MVVTATEVTVFTNINASAVTILNSGLIPIVQERISMMTNNYFATELFFEDRVTFNAAARSITTGSASFDEYNFLAGDDMVIYRSYRNDGIYSVLSVSGKTVILTSACSVVDELSGPSIYMAVVKWPQAVKYAAAQMVAYDHDTRPSVSQNITSRSLGPLSESYTNSTDEWGYPKSIMEMLVPYRIARLS